MLRIGTVISRVGSDAAGWIDAATFPSTAAVELMAPVEPAMATGGVSGRGDDPGEAERGCRHDDDER